MQHSGQVRRGVFLAAQAVAAARAEAVGEQAVEYRQQGFSLLFQRRRAAQQHVVGIGFDKSSARRFGSGLELRDEVSGAAFQAESHGSVVERARIIFTGEQGAVKTVGELQGVAVGDVPRHAHDVGNMRAHRGGHGFRPAGVEYDALHVFGAQREQFRQRRRAGPVGIALRARETQGAGLAVAAEVDHPRFEIQQFVLQILDVGGEGRMQDELVLTPGFEPGGADGLVFLADTQALGVGGIGGDE